MGRIRRKTGPASAAIQNLNMSTSPAPKPLARSTEDEALAAFESIPLFMKSLPEDDIQNPALSALQSLIYEGTPDGGSDISPIHLF